MTIIVYFSTIFLNLIFAFRKKQSKIVTIISLVVIVLLMAGIGPNRIGQNDYINYQIGYARIENISFSDNPQIGYTLLMKLGNSINLSFFMFRLLVIAFCLILLYKLVIKRYSSNSNFILMLYMLYPMIIDSEHLRNFIAMTIFLISIRFLESGSFKNNIKFLLMILVATSFHTAFFLYGFLVFANTKDKNRFAKIIASVTIGLTIVTILNNNQIPLLNSIINIISDDKITGYLSSRTNLGFLIPIVLHGTNIALLYWSRKILNRKRTGKRVMLNENRKLEEEIKFSNIVFWLNMISIVYFPLFIMSLQFYRLVRNLLLLNFVVYYFASYRLKSISLYKLIFNISILGTLAFWLVMDLMVTTSIERVLIPFFTQNYFFN